MALSDRVALLRAGLLEQVAPPRAIYGQPATAYAAEFIGQTNLLHAEVRDGIARAGSIAWHTREGAGNAVYSLRPECIRLAQSGAAGTAPEGCVARFRGRICNQSFGGATDLVEVDCGNSSRIRVRLANPGVISGEHAFEFDAHHATLVREGDVA